jgi:pimeloyl-ACP methyl ester carboxylesterase
VLLLGTTPVASAVETVRVAVGSDTLAASVFPAARSGRSPAILLFPGSERMSREMYRKFAARFAQEGFVAVTFDRRGEGESSGLWDDTQSLEPIAASGLAVLRSVYRRRSDIDSTFIALWGVSQGGWTGTIAAAREPAVKLAILVSDPALTTHEENLNERAWRLREQGFNEQEVREITDVRRILWRYYATGTRPADFTAMWESAKKAPWFARVGWPTWEPTPDSLSAETRAGYRRNHDPVPFIRTSQASVLRMYGREDRHMDPVASLAAARAAYRGIDRDTTFVMYPNRGHILESTLERPECPTCPHDMSRFAGGFDFDETIWQDVLAWVRPRLATASRRMAPK